jgi:TldD protein
MTDNLELARQQILTPAALEDRHLHRVLHSLLGTRLDYADLYFEHNRTEAWTLEDGIVKEGSHSLTQGVGVRAVAGEKTGFAYAEEIELPALQQAAGAARAIARRGGHANALALRPTIGRSLYAPQDPVASLPADAKVRLLGEVDACARSLDPRVTQVIVSLTGQHKSVLIAASDGTLAGDVRPLIRCNVSIIVEHDGRRETGTYGGGGRFGYEWLLESDRARGIAREAVRQALVNLEAEPAPAGEMTVVLGPGWPGILLHEAIGHGLEGDFNRKGTSAFAGRLGQRVAAPGCTVVDDGTLDSRRGSLNVDDEGMRTQRTVLIEDGILRGYMQDKHNAHLMGVPSTGNGRRQSYAHRPMPRMTNTYMLAGPYDPAEIIASVDRGLYAVNFGGGQVDITNGKFVFSAAEAYRIENGRITTPVKGATLIGNGPDVLTRVSMIGNDLQLDPGIGTCGKNGQSVPVGVGQPTLRIDNLTVGGTQSASKA